MWLLFSTSYQDLALYCISLLISAILLIHIAQTFNMLQLVARKTPTVTFMNIRFRIAIFCRSRLDVKTKKHL